MNYILLLGAGFSRNWGGWLANEVFEYLLGADRIRNNPYLHGLLWHHQRAGGGFETALGELQRKWLKEIQDITAPPHFSEIKENLDIFQRALETMFKDMNASFDRLHDMEFDNDMKYMLRTMLFRFDAIFTLNQDQFIERHYHNANIQLGSNGKWNSWSLPGVNCIQGYIRGSDTRPLERVWVPDMQLIHQSAPKLQPYFKLHGSSLWRDGSDNELLIMGSDKEEAIKSREVLQWYQEEFARRLCNQPCRLMVIGYGFCDSHINTTLMKAAKEGGLEIFIIDPSGTEVLQNAEKKLRSSGETGAAIDLHGVLEPFVIGASRRQLREIFTTSGEVEHSKVMRFFS